MTVGLTVIVGVEAWYNDASTDACTERGKFTTTARRIARQLTRATIVKESFSFIYYPLPFYFCTLSNSLNMRKRVKRL
jgi:hypothetical protein